LGIGRAAPPPRPIADARAKSPYRALSTTASRRRPGPHGRLAQAAQKARRADETAQAGWRNSSTAKR